jgi:sulfur relay (sulfurtransferase) DsrC/TusE family protein
MQGEQLRLMDETDLHYKVVQFIRRFFEEAIVIAGLGELQDTSDALTRGAKATPKASQTFSY